MALAAGDRLGPYEIAAPLGAGGMGEVYKATDTRLDRTVAVKVLPEAGPDLKERFEREARVVAALQHPHICTLLDVGSENGVEYLVMEYLDGETLKCPQPLGKVLEYGAQIADALEAAHRKGVTHRDLKPANIMITKTGVKLLDFGIAKWSRDKRGRSEDATLTKALTGSGVMIGTLPYMAPEQLEGTEADARTDLWALGAVLYEMVTGRRAFEGKSQVSLIAAIAEHEPRPMGELQPVTPDLLERAVKRCLAKDPERRWQSALDVKLELESIRDAPAAGPGKRRGPVLPWAVGAAGILFALAAAFVDFREKPAEQPPMAVSILPPEKALIDDTAISPDGKLLAFTATSEKGKHLWVRPLSSPAARLLAGTEEAALPFWSPDSRSIGFFAQGKLKKIEASGGAVEALCEARFVRGGTWSREGVIVFCRRDSGLWSVPAGGGTPTQLMDDQSRNERYARPDFLPEGKHFLYSVRSNDGSRGIYMGALGSTKKIRLLGGAQDGRYAAGPAGEGYLLFVREGFLMAQPFDAAGGVTGGTAFPVLERPVIKAATGLADFSVSENGILVSGASDGGRRQMAWVDREGKRLALLTEPEAGSPAGGTMDPRLSPDEKQVAYTLASAQGESSDVWLLDLAKGVPTRFTFHAQVDFKPIWSPDGKRIVFSSIRGGLPNLYMKSSSGSGVEEMLLEPGNARWPSDWSPDGRYLLYHENDPNNLHDLWLLPMEGGRKAVPFLRTEFNETSGTFSPDGKWIAYGSTESGREEVYVQPFPATGAKWQVSHGGGGRPRWRQDGKELFWLTADGTMMAAEVSLGPTVQAGIKSRLFETTILNPLERYSVSRDGRRFLIPLPAEEAEGSRAVTVMQNWLAGAKR